MIPKRNPMSINILIFALIPIIALLLTGAIAIQANMPLSILSTTITPTIETPSVASPQPHPTLTPTPTPDIDSVTYREILAVYKEVLTAVQWIMTVFLGLLTISGVGALYLYQRGINGISDVRSALDSYKHELENQRIQNQELIVLNSELRTNLQHHQGEVDYLRKDIETLKTKVRTAQSDFESRIPRLETLADVDTYTMRLFGTNGQYQMTAKKKLVEYSKDSDPVVRRECIRSFGAMLDYPECFTDPYDPAIIERLNEIAKNDSERGVRLEAKSTLEKFNTTAKKEAA